MRAGELRGKQPDCVVRGQLAVVGDGEGPRDRPLCGALCPPAAQVRMVRGWAGGRGASSPLLCVRAGTPSGLASAPAAGPASPVPAPCQLEDRALDALLGLLRRRLPVPLRLLRLVRRGRRRGGDGGGPVRRPARQARHHPGLQPAALRSLAGGALGRGEGGQAGVLGLGRGWEVCSLPRKQTSEVTCWVGLEAVAKAGARSGCLASCSTACPPWGPSRAGKALPWQERQLARCLGAREGPAQSGVLAMASDTYMCPSCK